MTGRRKRHPIAEEDAHTGEQTAVQPEQEPPRDEEPTTLTENDQEIYDLGYIVEDHTDRRTTLLERWQRLETLDTDEPLETNPAGPLPEETEVLRREDLPEEWFPGDAYTEHAEAEAGEVAFAEANRLLIDPDAELATQREGGEEVAAADLDRDQVPETVDLRGHAPGVTSGLGSSVPLDIGAEGFSIEENPLVVPVAALEYPISTEPLSDEARGLRDVAEIGTEEEVTRLADRGARLEEHKPR
jgi:hypothetical protein